MLTEERASAGTLQTISHVYGCASLDMTFMTAYTERVVWAGLGYSLTEL